MSECTCGETSVGETVRNKYIGLSTTSTKNQNHQKHIFLNIGHTFNWSVLLSATKNTISRKNLEAFFIAKIKPSLNEQVESNALNLFSNGIT